MQDSNIYRNILSIKTVITKSNAKMNLFFILKYLYINILRVVTFLMFGMKAAHYRASTLFAVCTSLNFFSILELIGLRLSSNVIGVMIFIWVLLAMYIFRRNSLHEKISTQFENDGYYSKMFGIIVILFYIITSLYVFFKLRI